jgi:membrane protein implicated in regulation of membrane protease activity
MLLMGFVMAFPILGILLFFVLPLREALPIYLVFTSVSALCHWAMMHSMKQPACMGDRAMIGSIGVVLRWEGRTGQINWRDEIWQAETTDGRRLAPGDRVLVDHLSGLTLAVRPTDPEALTVVFRKNSRLNAA